ncbi:putative glucuronoxylan glucuronosyltransferase F8H, partial [Tetrabaena socialis]
TLLAVAYLWRPLSPSRLRWPVGHILPAASVLQDGVSWPCDGSLHHEPFCVNQCTGHGDCHVGFCRCHAGWYGQDCSRKRAGTEMEPAARAHAPAPTYLREVDAGSNLVAATVYDMPTAYTSRMLQYRHGGDACLWRRFADNNDSFVMLTTYSVEIYMHEAMLQSDHRTFDPEEADFFYVPMYVTCYVWPIMGWSDHPWWHAPIGELRTAGRTRGETSPTRAGPMAPLLRFPSPFLFNMITEAHEWLQQFPWWSRRGGRDHIWLMAHDEGACYMPTHVFNASIVLTHWGRTELNHTSNTAYDADNYNLKTDLRGWKGADWQDKMAGHPCYLPDKHLVIPAFKIPGHAIHSPLMGAPPLVRDLLLFFRGDLGSGRKNHYSRGIRQKLFHLAHDGNWAERHKIYIGNSETVPGPYSEYLARSKFCLVAPGDGWSPRLEDAMLHGCVPLIVMDGVHAVFESILEYDSFSIRLPEADLARVPELLAAVPPERLLAYQRNLARVWH